jgi:hypothetical protein
MGSTPPPVPKPAHCDEGGQRQPEEQTYSLEDSEVAGEIEQMECGDHAFEEQHEQQSGEQRFDRDLHVSSAGIARPLLRVSIISQIAISQKIFAYEKEVARYNRWHLFTLEFP